MGSSYILSNKKRLVCMFILGIFVRELFHLLKENMRSAVDQHNDLNQAATVHRETELLRLKFGEPCRKDKKTGNDMENDPHGSKPNTRKIFIDGGANVASSVDLFRDTYPGGPEFIIHSFEIDSRLAPYFRPYHNHHLHCPVGVATKQGTMTAYIEGTWEPDMNKERKMYNAYTANSLHATETEAEDVSTGGPGRLTRRPTVPVIDLSRWIQENTNKDDYVILKLDIEGSEFDILKKMMEDNTFQWIDKLYGEFHTWKHLNGWTVEQIKYFKSTGLKKNGQRMINWDAARRLYDDFKEIHPVKISRTQPGYPGGVFSSCGNTGKVAVTLRVGMNVKRARKIVAILEAYNVSIPVMLFIHGDFADIFSEDVKLWADRFDIGVREDGHFPPGHFEMMKGNYVRQSLVSSELRLQEIGIQPVFYLPVHLSTKSVHLIKEAKQRGFRIIKPAADFPPTEGETLDYNNYYRLPNDVSHVEAALQILHKRLLQTRGGILTFDTDLPDTRIHLVFLLDYLQQTAAYELVSVEDCVQSFMTNTVS